MERGLAELNENAGYRFQTFDEISLRRFSNTSSLITEPEQHISHAKFPNGAHVSRKLMNVIEKISEKLESINEQLETEKEQFFSGYEWRTFALVLDRLFMIVYIVFLSCGCTTLALHFIVFKKEPSEWV